MSSPGFEQKLELMRAGYTQDEITSWETEQRGTLYEAGFSNADVDEHFGLKPFDKKVVGALAGDYKKAAAEEDISFVEAVEKGFQRSTAGLALRGELPEPIEGEEKLGFFDKLTIQGANLAGDFPAMVAGGVAGSLTSTPGLGTLVGAFTLPEVLRTAMMDAYEKGEIRDSQDFLDRTMNILEAEAKSAVIATATFGAGKGAKLIAPAAGPITSGLLTTTSEIGAMTTVAAGLEGELPEPEDFMNAAILIGGLKGAGAVTRKLRKTYAKTGATPDRMAEAALAETANRDLLVTDQNIFERPTPFKPIKPKAIPEDPILSKVSVGAREVKGAGYGFKEAYADFVDRMYPLKEVTEAITKGEGLDITRDPYRLARLTNGVHGKIESFLKNGTFRPGDIGKKTGKSLQEIVDSHKGDLDGFRKYMVSKRAVELDARGIKTGIDTVEATKAVAEGSKKYEKSFRDLVEYQNALLDYYRDSGMISAKVIESMKEANKDYVPFNRVVDRIQRGFAEGLEAKQILKRIKGSELDVIDPLESIIKNTNLYLQMAERNSVGKALAELGRTVEGGEKFVTKVKTKVKPIDLTEAEVKQIQKAYREEFGVDIPAEAATVFRPQALSPRADQIVVYENGKPTLYKVDPKVADVFKGMDIESTNTLMKILKAPASLLRAGAILTPEFVQRNAIRDQLTAFVLTGGHYKPFLDFIGGISSLRKRDASFQSWLKSGGPGSALVSLERRYLQKNIRDLQGGAGRLDRAINVAKHPIEQLRVISELVENATRLGEFKRNVKGKEMTQSQILEAGLASRDVTLDFARMGAKMKAMNQIVAFLNAQVQGVDRTIRAFKDNPKGTALAVAAGVTLPSVLLWAVNHDDPRWKEIPDWQRDLFWIVTTESHVFRIPKPFEVGVIFGSGAERALDAMFDDDPEAFDGFLETIGEAAVPSLVPTATIPFLEAWGNKSFFTGGPLIPARLEGQLPEYQYRPYTTELTKELGRLTAMIPGLKFSKVASPIIVENFLSGWTGGLGKHMLNLADQALRAAGVIEDPQKPTKTLSDLPVVKAFIVRHPSSSTQPVIDFYDKYQEQRTILNTIKKQASEGNVDAAIRESELDPGALVSLDGIASAISDLNKYIRMVSANPEIEPDEQRQLIDETYYMLTEIAKAGNDIMRSIDKALKE